MAAALQAINRTMRWEGWSITNIPGDKGKFTCCGISKVYNPRWRGWEVLERTGNKIDDEVKTLVLAFYMAEFNALHLDRIDSQPIADQIYQAYTNIGNRAIRWAQEIAGVTPDAIIGNMTIAAINDTDEFMFTEKFCKKQIAYYDAIIAYNPEQKKFEVGWKMRANDFRLR